MGNKPTTLMKTKVLDRNRRPGAESPWGWAENGAQLPIQSRKNLQTGTAYQVSGTMYQWRSLLSRRASATYVDTDGYRKYRTREGVRAVSVGLECGTLGRHQHLSASKPRSLNRANMDSSTANDAATSTRYSELPLNTPKTADATSADHQSSWRNQADGVAE